MNHVKYLDLLLEKHLQNLYHATDIFKVLQMLKDDAVKLTFQEGADEMGKKSFYLSTMRSKFGHYADMYHGKGSEESGGYFKDKIPANPSKRTPMYDAIVNLNGSAVGSVAKVKSVEYWGPEFRKEKSFREEQEERIFSNKSEFSPLKNYVDEIHIFIKPEPNKYFQKTFLSIPKLAEERGVPVYFYTEPKYYMGQVKSKAIKEEDLERIVGIPHFEKDEEREYPPSSRPKKEIQALIDIYKENKSDTDEYKHAVELLKYYHYDAYPSIEADIHNAKYKHLKEFEELGRIMRKENSYSVKDFVDLLIKKAEKL